MHCRWRWTVVPYMMCFFLFPHHLHLTCLYPCHFLIFLPSRSRFMCHVNGIRVLSCYLLMGLFPPLFSPGKARKWLAGATVRSGSMWRTVVISFKYMQGVFSFSCFIYYSVIAADLILHTTDRICVLDGWNFASYGNSVARYLLHIDLNSCLPANIHIYFDP